MEYREEGKVKDVGFIEGDTLRANDGTNTYIVEDFNIENIHTSGINLKSGLGFQYLCDVSIFSISKQFVNDNKPTIEVDWFIGSLPRIYFSNQTYRCEDLSCYKLRDGLDTGDKVELQKAKTKSVSWDFTTINDNNLLIIIQTVDNEYVPEGVDGISIEYRSSDSRLPTEEYKKMVSEFLSFVLGSHLQKIGSTNYSNKYEVLKTISQNPWKSCIKKNENHPPIPLRKNSERAYIKELLDKLFPSFVKNYKTLSLSDSLWKFWIGIDQPIGTDLPILAAGLESLVNSYLKEKKVLKKYTMKEKEEYNKLISDELDSLKTKLEGYDFGQFVLNKIENPYGYGIGEKFKLFYNQIGFDFDKNSIETLALGARNIMIHRDTKLENIEDQQKAIKTSQAYWSLYYRTLLKLLDYAGYYCDYSKEGVRYLDMKENM